MGLWQILVNNGVQEEVVDYSTLGVDIHSHLIPGIDDGAATMEESLEMIRGLASMGFRKLIATPHIFRDYYLNTPETILQGLHHVKTAAAKEKIPVQLEAAAEYMLDDGFEEIAEKGDLLAIDGRFLLLELSTYSLHPGFQSVIFDLQVAGYKIILAHVERYAYWFGDLKFYEELKNREVMLQVNLLSFSGFYSTIIRKQAEKLADHQLIDLLGTDIHHPRMIPAYRKTYQEKYVQNLLSSGNLMNTLF